MTNPETDLIHAPWSAGQVTALNAFQHHGCMHPFTCGATHASGQSPVLVATHSGWVCPDPQCVYRQDWAHAFMAEGAPVRIVTVPPPAAVSVPPPAPRADDRAALRDRAAEAICAAACPGSDCRLSEAECSEQRIQPAAWERGVLSEVYGRPEWFADAVLAVLPEPADAPAAECSAQNRNYESGPRLCIRAAQHHGDHIDERGFHWSDTVAVYPLGDGTFRTGVNLRAALHRAAAVSGPCVAGEQQNETPEAEAPTITQIRTVANDCCCAEPPADGTWGDCWCTLPPGHDGEHQCQPCTDRHGAPGWSDAATGVRQDGATS